MRFAAKEDLAAPIDTVFSALSDFQGFERLALNKGAEVIRMDQLKEAAPGMAWDLGFRLRGRKRRVSAVLQAYEPPSGMRFAGQSPNLDIVAVLSLIALSRQRTRLSVEFELLPRSLTARILLQSARLGKSVLTRRFQARVARFARFIGERAGAPSS